MRVDSESEMLGFGEFLAQNLPLPVVIELVGDVGVGKTTFTRGFARGLGVAQPVTSPSFTISKRYALPHGGELVHYDFYRLDDPGIMREELSETLRRPHSAVIIEWGSDVSGLLPANHIRLEFSLNPDGSRSISAHGLPADLWKTCGKLRKKCVQNSEICGKPVENYLNSVQKPSKPVENSPKMPSKAVKNPNSPSTIKLYLDTSSDVCILRLNDNEYTREGKYELAENIFQFIYEKLRANHADWTDVSEITFFSGPGSFTGLRIGAALVNALADELNIPLFDHHGRRHAIIIPDYGREANISKPRK